MKILCDNNEKKKVYVQKRDILYLESKGESAFSLANLQTIDSTFSLDSIKNSEFLLYEGEKAFQYFNERKEILDYLDYLELTSDELLSYMKYQKESYLYQALEELFFEKEGLRGLKYPITPENTRKVAETEDQHAQYQFYMSLEIPQLFFFKKIGEIASINEHSIPLEFREKCSHLARFHAKKENFIPIPEQEDMLLYMPVPEEEKKQEDFSKQKKYLKKFINTFKKG